MNKTKIDWCDSTWNPVTGCLHECKYCYARGIAKRFGGLDGAGMDGLLTLTERRDTPYPAGFMPTLHRYRLDDYKDKKGRNIFVCSMADLFGRWVPDEWIEEVFRACAAAPQHNYIFLTKNPRRYISLAKAGKLPKEHWYGWTVTDKGNTHRNTLYEEYNTFVSFEPLLADPCYFDYIEIPLIRWAIIGAESGNRKDKVIPKREWIEKLVDQCRAADVPVFMKESLTGIWGDQLIQEFSKNLVK